MGTKPYAVVYFKEEDMYSEIPTSWLLNEEQCYWPRSLNPHKLMKRREAPDASWDIYIVEIVGYSATLDGARKKAANSEYATSSNDDWKCGGRGRRKKLPACWTEETVTSTDEESMTPPPTPIAIPQKQGNVDDCRDNSNNLNEAGAEGISIIPSNDETYQLEVPITTTILPNETNHEINSEDVATGPVITLNLLYEEIVKLRTICLSNKKYLNTIYTKLHSLEFGHQVTNFQHEAIKNLPLKTLHEVEDFEKQLLDTDKIKSSLLHLFKYLGGRDGKDHLNRSLAQLFTNELATQCSWYGQRGNFKTKDLNSIKILTESIITCHTNMTYSEIEKYAGEWFRLSRQRLNRQKVIVNPACE